MKEIQLTQGQVALVDNEDFELVSRYKWYAHKDGDRYYVHTNIRIGDKRVTLQMHCLLFPSQSGRVDHINGNGCDNRRENLRVCTASQNSQNMRKFIGKSKYKGVFWDGDAKKWRAQIRVNSKRLHLGRFLNDEEAALAYNVAAEKYFGEFALLNRFDEE
jgi:hypothetical protein